jgi:hypothetical protein
VQTEPRLTKTKATASALRSTPWPVISDRKLPPSVAGAAAAPAATTTTPKSCETRLATGNAVSAASTASLPDRDQRVKSAVMVPLSAKVATTSVTAPANVMPPAWPANCVTAPRSCVLAMIATATRPRITYSGAAMSPMMVRARTPT